MKDEFNDKVMTVGGAYQTHKGTDEQYAIISVQELMTLERTAVPKDEAQWVLCSTYNEPDGRRHEAHRQHGRFVMLAVDMDDGNVQGKALVAAVQAFTGVVQMRVYSSSSATVDARKWRVLIPLAEAMRHDEWLSVTTALNRSIESATGVRPDRALERPGQPIYLPNTAPRTDGIEPLIANNLVEGPLLSWRDAPGSDLVLQVMAEHEQQAAERGRLAAEARRKMAQMRARPDTDKSVIQQFNEAHDLEAMLTACGYAPGPNSSWRSPNQQSGSYGTAIFDEPAGQYWVSQSMSDLDAGVGNKSSSGSNCFGDAFDLYAFYHHSNDRTQAIKAAAGDLGIKQAPSAVDMLAERLRANRLKQQPALHPVAVAEEDVEFPDEPTQHAQQVASQAIERAAESAAAPATAVKESLTADDKAKDETMATRTLSYVQASHLPDWTPPQELVEGMLLQGGMTVIYGDSNTGKSFLTLDMVAHISLGRAWMGRKVQQGAVVYLAAESPRSIVDRARALATHMGEPLDRLFIVNCPIDLYNPDGDALAVVNTISEIEAKYKTKVRCVVADTLARVMGAGDENKAMDMGVVIKHIDLIRAATEAQFILIHHTGKDKTNGARGSSSLRAATDTEIEVSDREDGSPKEAKVTKQRDLPGKNTSVGFELAIVELGVGLFGSVFTTCVVEEKAPRKADPELKLKGYQVEVLDFIRSNPPSVKWAAITNAVKAANPKCNDSTVSRALETLLKLNLITKTLGMYAAIGNRGNGLAAGNEF